MSSTIFPGSASAHFLAFRTPERLPPDNQPALVVFQITPWADVTVDGHELGRAAQPYLSPGRHQLVLTHPDYDPYRAVVSLRPGETRTLSINLKDQAVRKR